MTAAEIAKALGGATKTGGQWLCRCPVHDDQRASLTIRDTESGLLWFCHANCDGRDIGRELRRRGLLDDGERRRREVKPNVASPVAGKAPDPRKVRWLFDKALPLKGSPAERYLIEVRGSLILPPHDAVRFMPAMPPHYSWPAMVSLVSDFADANRALTLHFTDLLADGSGKAPVSPAKRTLAGFPMKGGVVRLTDDAEVTPRLGIAEGIETSLSVMSSFLRDEGRVEHVWSAVNAGNLGELQVLPGIETLVIYADRGPAGEKAADKLAQRWIAADREVFIATHPVDDWNPQEAAP